MSISFRAASTATTGNTTALSITGTLPSGTHQSDILIPALYVSGNNHVSSAPTGYTAATGTPLYDSSTGNTLYVYTRVVGASEPTSPTWTFDTAHLGTLVMASFVGGNTSTPQDVTPTTKISTSSTSSPSPSAITTTTDGDMIVAVIAVDSATSGCTFTAPESGYAQAGTISTVFGGDGYPVQIAYKLQSAHGTETPGSATISAASRGYSAFTLALTGPGPTPPPTVSYCMGILNY